MAGLAGLHLPGMQSAYDISGVLSDETGIGAFLRAILGYSASPEVATLAAHVAYVVAVLWLYLRPTRPADPARRATVAGA